MATIEKSKILLLSGPRLSGKDTATDYLNSKGYNLTKRECKDHLHKLVQLFFLVSEERYWEIYNNRDLKEKPLADFRIGIIAALELFHNILKVSLNIHEEDRKYEERMLNLSIREAMILVSELVAKRIFSKAYFGQALADSIQDGEICVDSSCGFKEEIPPVIDKLGQKNILLIRIRGRGSFEGDSRNYIPDNIIDNTVDIWNNGSEDEFLEKVEKVVSEFIGGEYE